MDPSHLKRLDSRALHAAVGGVDAYMVVRNEIERLPHVLDHHRRLGVDRFFVVDNGSADGTVDYLLAQWDCRVYGTSESFAGSNCGMDWINAMVEWHGEHRWCLFIDADELFVYPHCEEIRLPELCRLLDEAGHEGVFAIMVDMYGENGLGEEPAKGGVSLLEACPLYDGDYLVRKKIARPFARRFLEVEAVGGPRLRVFYPHLREAGIWRMFLARTARALRHSSMGSSLARLGWGACPPDITKIPLIRAGKGRVWTSNHRTTPLKLAPVSGALLHFKLLAGFAERARIEVARGEHWGAGSEYARYDALLKESGDVSFVYEGTRRYGSSRDLVRDGIIRSVPELDALAASDSSTSHPTAAPEVKKIS